VLDAIVGLGPEIIRLPDSTQVPKEIFSNTKMFPYFSNCIGALDGTHIPATPSPENYQAFRNRKGFPSQNVLAACSFDLKFVYVLAGWEGSGSDAGIFAEAVCKDFAIPEGKYYLGDAGYALNLKCLTPYRFVRYHLREWSQGNQRPRNAKELFNLRHSQLRNAIERIFGVLKKRFPILTTYPEYRFDAQVRAWL
jgi:hypothetical protein